MDDANMQFVFESFLLNGCCLAKRQRMYMVPFIIIIIIVIHSHIVLHCYHLIWYRSEEGAETGWAIYIHRACRSKWYYAGIFSNFTMRIGTFVCSSSFLFFFHGSLIIPCLCRWDTSQIITAGC